jgi:hypothetical protein
VASLQARSPLRSAHPLLLANKIVSLSAFIVLLGAGWVALSYLKSDGFDRWRSGASEIAVDPKNAQNVAADATLPEIKQQAAPMRLVYSCAADKEHYHAPTHLPARCERIALGEEAAIQRGLKRCMTCFPD